jgi:hypothetical protein
MTNPSLTTSGLDKCPRELMRYPVMIFTFIIIRIYINFCKNLPTTTWAGNSVVECRIAAHHSRSSRSHRFDSGSALTSFLPILFWSRRLIAPLIDRPSVSSSPCIPATTPQHQRPSPPQTGLLAADREVCFVNVSMAALAGRPIAALDKVSRCCVWTRRCW